MMLAQLTGAIRKWFAVLSPRAYARSILRDGRASLGRVARDRAALAALGVLFLPWGALLLLRDNFDWLRTLGEMAAILGAFWWLSRAGGLPAPPVKYPRAESLFAFALIVIWVGWRIGICAKGFSFLPTDFVCYKNWTFEIIPKLIEQVILPVAALFLLGYRWRALGLALNLRAWWISSLAIFGVVGYGIYTHWNALPDFGQRTVEFFFGAGLPEEMLFRAVLLTRLEAWWRNSAWALLGASVIFGLTHLPINLLVFSPQNPSEAWLTLLTFQMGMGAVFGFAYQRTRNVLPLAVLHAGVNAL
jgi:membrane protease YdiL (CAAX protease family)